MSGARYWERIDEAAPRPTYVSMALPTFPYKDLWGGVPNRKNPFCLLIFFVVAPTSRFLTTEGTAAGRCAAGVLAQHKRARPLG